jgi:endonuclease YncB( thermonuclease family)
VTVHASGEPLVIRPILVESVHDGDSLTVQLPLKYLWPGVRDVGEKIRLAHVNAPELATTAGKDARGEVVGWVLTHGPFELVCYGREKYGRLLADLRSTDGSGDLLSEFVAGLGGTARVTLRDQLMP